jgi:hypothetical protein
MHGPPISFRHSITKPGGSVIGDAMNRGLACARRLEPRSLCIIRRRAGPTGRPTRPRADVALPFGYVRLREAREHLLHQIDARDGESRAGRCRRQPALAPGGEGSVASAETAKPEIAADRYDGTIGCAILAARAARLPSRLNTAPPVRHKLRLAAAWGPSPSDICHTYDAAVLAVSSSAVATATGHRRTGGRSQPAANAPRQKHSPDRHDKGQPCRPLKKRARWRRRPRSQQSAGRHP